MKLLSLASIFFILTRTFIIITPAAASCYADGTITNTPSEIIAELTISASQASAGQQVQVSWKIGEGQSPYDSLLVVRFPKSTRFGGQGFFALPPKARAPFSILTGSDDVRIVVPLTGPLSNRNGSASVSFFDWGTTGISWSIIELMPSEPQKCIEVVKKSGKLQVEIQPGPPEIVTQDRFATGSPKDIHISPDERYILSIFANRYEVQDRVSGALLIDRAGLEPRFSTSGRFLSAKTGEGIEVIDIASRRVVRATDGRREYGYPDAVAWVDGDSLIVISYPRQAAFEIIAPLIDGRVIFSGALGCNACPGLGTTKIWFDIDHLTFSTLSASPYFDARMTMALVEAADSPKTVEAARNSGAEDLIPSLRVPRFTVAHQKFKMRDGIEIPAKKDGPLEDFFWVASDTMYFTHLDITEPTLRRIRSSGSVLLEIKRFPLNEYKISSNNNAPVARRGFRVGIEDVAPRSMLSRVRAALTRVNVSLAELSESTVKRHKYTENLDYNAYLKNGESLIESLAGDVRSSNIFSGARFSRTYRYFEDEARRNAEAEVVISAPMIESVFRVEIPEGPLLVIQQGDRNGTAPDLYGELILVTLPRGGTAEYRRISASYSDGGVVSAPINLDVQRSKAGEALELTLSPDLTVAVSGNKFLLIASKVSGSVAIFDLAANQIVGVFNAVENGDDIRLAALTEDCRHLLLLTEGGLVNFYNLRSGQKVLSGRFVDDELAIYDNALAYDATEEGAAYVYLQIPGDVELYSLDQFKARLRQPGLIAARLKDAPPSGSLPPILLPPSLQLEIGKESVKARISATNKLDRLHIYVDGVKRQEIKLSGNSEVATVPTRELEAARWFSFVAEDQAGLLSLPRLVSANSARKYRGSLRSIFIGIDKYHSRQVSDLKYAESDARRFEASLRRRIAPNYSGYRTRFLLGSKASSESIEETIRDATSNAVSSDALIIFIAGHGLITREGFALALPPTRGGDIQTYPFVRIAELIRDARERVFIFIDACHSAGMSSDEAVGVITAANPNVVILSASKGSQLSSESSRWGGGVFTTALINAIQRQKAVARDNSLNLEDVYFSLKREVVSETNGRQIPWLRRATWAGPLPID